MSLKTAILTDTSTKKSTRVRSSLSGRGPIMDELASLLSKEESVKGEVLRKMLSESTAGMKKASVKLKSKRMNTMKSSTKDKAEGTMHKVKGKIKEIVGKISKNPELEDEGKEEGRTGKVQEKIGDVKKVVGK